MHTVVTVGCCCGWCYIYWFRCWVEKVPQEWWMCWMLVNTHLSFCAFGNVKNYVWYCTVHFSENTVCACVVLYAWTKCLLQLQVNQEPRPDSRGCNPGEGQAAINSVEWHCSRGTRYKRPQRTSLIQDQHFKKTTTYLFIFPCKITITRQGPFKTIYEMLDF